MKILAIDPGSMEAGFACGGIPWTEYMSGTRAERFAQFATVLEGILYAAWESDCPFDLVAYERPFARGRDATRCLWGLAGLIEAAAQKAGAAVIDIPNQTLKKWATEAGKRRDKEPMIAAMEKLTGYTGLDEHQADALCIFEYVVATMVVTAAQEKCK